MRYFLSEESFLKDVATHEMVVIRNDGVNRHIRFTRPNTSCYHFDLITWPGVLCYTGDMGTFVFMRMKDMFEFFRTEREYKKKHHDSKLAINVGYWAEKVIAQDRDGVEKFSADMFRERIQEWLNSAEASDDVREAVDDEVLSEADNGEYAAYHAAYHFEHDGFEFTDFFEVNCKEYTHRFLWCCYALAWGIEKFDQSTADIEVTA